MFNDLKAEYDASIASQSVVGLKTQHTQRGLLQNNRAKRLLLLCLMGQSGVELAGKRRQWILPNSYQKAFLIASLLRRYVMDFIHCVSGRRKLSGWWRTLGSWTSIREIRQNWAPRFWESRRWATTKLVFVCVHQLSPGKKVFWHSSAHVLGEAAERHYGCHLCLGPPTDDGFFYEMATDRPVTVSDYPALEKVSELVIKEKQKFERLVVSKENLLKMFNVSPVVIELHLTYFPIVSSTINTSSTSSKQRSLMIPLPQSIDVVPWWIYVLDLIYPTPERSRHSWLLRYCLTTLCLSGWLTDLGQNSASYFLGDAANDSLQRIYGISFPDKKQLVEYKAFLVEAAKRDHRKIGKDQELFFFHDLSPGSCFFLPHGARIYNALVELMRSEYFKRGYQEVISPNMYNSKLWETSGHWQNYRDDMFVLDVEKEKWALKPMNCPGHALIFDSRDRSYKELPIRMAEFGIIHRNEASGALTGLTRVRKFVQDDTHVFCMPSQITEEIAALFDFMKHIYGLFGFQFKLELSTRPENYLGSIETWNQAEDVRMLVSNRPFLC